MIIFTDANGLPNNQFKLDFSAHRIHLIAEISFYPYTGYDRFWEYLFKQKYLSLVSTLMQASCPICDRNLVLQ